jgi:hypothetical protein
MSDDVIHIHDEADDATSRRWTEEMSVRGSDLASTLGRLGREAAVRKITVKAPGGRTIAEIPLVLGTAGVLLLGPWTAALLVAAWLGRVSIIIEYEKAPATMDEAFKQLTGATDKTAEAIEATAKSA